MFIQVIEGRTSDPAALQARLDLWDREVRPGAVGYLGSTGGCTDDGDVIVIARFEDEAAAQRNSLRPEQDAWWAETVRCFDGPVRFHDSVEVEVMRHGELGGARFVQVMAGHVTDKARAVQLEQEADPVLSEMRPDLLGAITAYHDDGAFTEVAYFTSEADARRAEQQQMPEELADRFAEWEGVMQVERYLDLRDPWMVEP